jgi:hypothetical protein
MGKRVTFYLGPVGAATVRTLTVTRMRGAGDDSAITPDHNADAGAVNNVSVNLDDNRMYQAQLVDELATGETSDADILNFHTGSLQFPGPKSGDRLQVVAMEEQSTSSSSHSSSSWSSPSASSSSSSSSVSSASSSSRSMSSSSRSMSSSSRSVSSSSSQSASSSSSSASSASSASSSSASSASSHSSSSWSSQS